MGNRPYYKINYPPLVKTRLNRKQCPICGTPALQNYQCCSKTCSSKWKNKKQEYGIQTATELRRQILERDGYRCVKCGKQPVKTIITSRTHLGNATTRKIIDTDKLIADHIIPLALGGEQFNPENIQTLCSECNRQKTEQDIQKIKETEE